MDIGEFADQGPQAAEDSLRQKLGENDYLVDLWQMGEQMRMFVETPAGKLLEIEFRQDFNRALRALLECDDAGSPAGRAAARRCPRLGLVAPQGVSRGGICQPSSRGQTRQETRARRGPHARGHGHTHRAP